MDIHNSNPIHPFIIWLTSNSKWYISHNWWSNVCHSHNLGNTITSMNHLVSKFLVMRALLKVHLELSQLQRKCYI